MKSTINYSHNRGSSILGDNEHFVFTYGTLMRGKVNHFKMEDTRFLGKATIDGFKLYDVGPYPGIKERDSGIVFGELYSVDDKKLAELDWFEGEGTLYKRVVTHITLTDSRMELDGYVYVYLGSVDDCPEIPDFLQPYKSVSSDLYMWYVAYGSNLLEERFLCYIQGKSFRGKCSHKACSNQTSPLGSVSVKIPHDIYFANESSTWGESGVAFLDVDVPGETLGRAWLITKEQFSEIHEKEGDSPLWYGRTFEFQKLLGFDTVTITKPYKSNETPPSEEYYDVIKEGTEETLLLLGQTYAIIDSN